MRRSIGALLFLHLFLIIPVMMFGYKRSIFKNFLKGYTNPGNGYDIFSVVIIALILIFSVVLPKLARMVSYLFYILLIVTIFYLEAFTINYFSKARNAIVDGLVSTNSMLFSASFGVMVALLFNKKELSFSIAVAVGFVLYFIFEVIITKVFKLHYH